MTMTPNEHGELRQQIELYAAGALTPAERTAFESHLAGCEECRAQVRSFVAVADAMAQVVPQYDPPPSLRSQVLAAVGATDRPPARASTAPLRTRAITPWIPAAALLIITIGLAAQTAVLRSRVTDLERRLAQAMARADASDRRVADAQRATNVAQSQIAVLTAPDLRRMDLGGQPISPQSSGRAFWSRSHGLVFTAANLPALPAGRTYQLWVLTAQPAPISAGVFKPDNGGRVAEMFVTPIDLPQPIGMAVTIEPDGGVPAPTGDKYLVGP
jgi:anti-sigma-K factor RskA